MSNVQIKLNQNGEANITCDESTAINILSKLVNRQITVTGKDKIKSDKVKVKSAPSNPNRQEPKQSWTKEEVKLVFDNLNKKPKEILELPELAHRTDKAKYSTFSRMKNKNYDQLGVKVANWTKEFYREQKKLNEGEVAGFKSSVLTNYLD